MAVFDIDALPSDYRQSVSSTLIDFTVEKSAALKDNEQRLKDAPKKNKSLLDLAEAALTSENTLVSVGTRLLSPTVENEDAFDATFSPRKQARADGLGEFVDEFNNARNRGEYDALKTRIQKRKDAQDTLTEYGWGGVAAGIAAGTIADPVFWASMFVAPEVGVPKAAGTVGRLLARSGRGAVEASVTEVPLQFADETRSDLNGAIAVAGSALTFGLLGAAADKVGVFKQKQIAAEIEGMLLAPTKPNGLQSIGAAAVEGAVLDNGSANKLKTNPVIKALMKVAKTTGTEGVGLTAARSNYEELRNAGEALMGDIWQREGTAAGRANVMSADIIKGLHQADVADTAKALSEGVSALDKLELIDDADKLVIFRQLSGMQVGVKSLDDITPEVVQTHFGKLVAAAMRSNDAHPLTAVEGAAKRLRTIFDRDYDKAVELGFQLVPREELLGAPSYFSRVFSRELVSANQARFINTIEPYIREKLLKMAADGIEGAEPYKAQDIASTITNSILGYNAKGGGFKGSAGTMTEVVQDLTEKGYGKLADRVLDVPDEVLAEFLENDPLSVMMRYKHSISPQLALKESTGYTDWNLFKGEKLDPTRAQLKSDLSQDLVQKPTTPEQVAKNLKLEKEIAAVDDEFNKVEEALAQAWKRIEGRASTVAENSFQANIIQGTRALRKVVNPVMLGGQVISSLVDAPRIAMTHALAPVLKAAGLRNFTSQFSTVSKDAAHRVGVGMELLLFKHRSLQRSSLGEAMDSSEALAPVTGKWGKVHGGLDVMNDHFQKWIGASWWNDMPRQVVAINAENRILTAAEKGWSTISKKDQEYLLVMGIDEAMLGKIKASAFDNTFTDVVDEGELSRIDLLNKERTDLSEQLAKTADAPNSFENSEELTSWLNDFNSLKDADGFIGELPKPPSLSVLSKDQLDAYEAQLRANLKATQGANGQVMSAAEAHKIATSSSASSDLAAQVWATQRGGWGKGNLVEDIKAQLAEVKAHRNTASTASNTDTSAITKRLAAIEAELKAPPTGDRLVQKNGAVTRVDGFYTSDAGTWSDVEAARYFKAAVYKDSTTTVNSPSVGTFPKWADGEVAKLALGFKSFILASFNQTLMVGLQRNDAQVYAAMAGMVAMGAAVEVVRSKVMGGRTPDKEYTVGELVWKGVDRSGIASLPWELANVADKLSGEAGIGNFMPYGGSHRYRGQHRGVEDLFGPVPAYAAKATKFSTSVFSGEKSAEELAYEGSRLLPGQNALGFRPYELALDTAFGQTRYLDNVMQGFKSTFVDLDFVADPDLSFASAAD